MKISKVDEPEGSSAVENLDPDTQRLRSTLARLDRLIDVLEQADVVFRCGSSWAREEALSRGLSVIGALYREVVDIDSSETSAHLVAAYDSCLDALGAAYAGDGDALLAAMTMAHAIRSAVAPSHASCRADCASCAAGLCRAA